MFGFPNLPVWGTDALLIWPPPLVIGKGTRCTHRGMCSSTPMVSEEGAEGRSDYVEWIFLISKSDPMCVVGRPTPVWEVIGSIPSRVKYFAGAATAIHTVDIARNEECSISIARYEVPREFGDNMKTCCQQCNIA